jgi:hypothetical protein
MVTISQEWSNDMDKQLRIVSEIVGIFRREDLNGKQVLEISETAKVTYLERCRHVSNENVPNELSSQSNNSRN